MRVFLIAGEPSGDALGAALMTGLQALTGDEVVFDGVGGPLMQARGLQSRFDMSELSVMGIAEILPKYFHLKRRISEMADAVVKTVPDVLITIDSPDFCLRVAKQVKARSSVRTVHYVAPTVWAWRPKRAAHMARFIDHVLALFPFEPPLMEAAGMTCDFVGHPVVAAPRATPEAIADFRTQQALAAGPVLLVLPGSRRSEIERLGPVFAQAIAQFSRDVPGLQAVVVAAPSVETHLRQDIADWNIPVRIVSGADPALKGAAFGAADLALAASGSVTLELAAYRIPMVVGYRMNALSYRIIRQMALIDCVALVNIVTGGRHVPECLGPECTPDHLALALSQVWKAPEAQIPAMEETMQVLGEGGEDPGLRAARAVLRGV